MTATRFVRPVRLAALAALTAVMLASHAGVQAQGLNSSGSAKAAIGRPAMSGAQGGTGVQAGLPQGGLGTQGNEGAQIRMAIRRPGQEDFPQGDPATGAPTVAAAAAAQPSPEPGVRDDTPKEKRDTAKRVTRAAKSRAPAAP